MVEEVRRQFREIKGILTGEAEPTMPVAYKYPPKEHNVKWYSPLYWLSLPYRYRTDFGVPGVIGLLIGGLSSGFVLAIFMANAGGAWIMRKNL